MLSTENPDKLTLIKVGLLIIRRIS